jgi:hypothetical protein
MKSHYDGKSAKSRLTKVRLAKVRFLIGVTDKEESFLSNEEIEFFLNEEKSDNMAAAKACEALIAKLRRLMNMLKQNILKRDVKN